MVKIESLEGVNLNNLELVVKLALIIASVCFFFVVVCFLYSFIRRFINKYSRNARFNSKLAFLTICLTISICSLQFLSELYAIHTEALVLIAKGESPNCVSGIEVFVSSFLHTLKAFGADDDFLKGMESFRKFMLMSFSENISRKIIYVYNVVAVCMSVMAPLTSATIILDVLTRFFPKLKYFFLHINLWSEKYFFSELNERSITLAKSIKELKGGSFKKIIFTNVNDSESEDIKVYLMEAKNLGAICFQENITCIRKYFFNKKKILLINDNEVENLEFFIELVDGKGYKNLKLTEIYLFSQNCNYSDTERTFREKFIKSYKFYDYSKKIYDTFVKKNKPDTCPIYIKICNWYIEKKNKNNDGFNKAVAEKGLVESLNDIYKTTYEKWCTKFSGIYQPTVIPVRHYRNLITNMLETTPLYEPIVHKTKDENRTLNVTILGIGDIGTEMFLNTYWMGQMLDCKLRINVVSKEPEGTFDEKLNYINPEILITTKKRDNILRIYEGREEFSEPYCEYNYFSCDIKSSKFKSLLNEEIANTHYFLVSLGSDEENLSVANMLKTEIGRNHIGDKAKGKQVEKTIINYVVYNSSLNKSLGAGNLICSYSNEEPDIYMQAVGGIENIYSAKNIFMENYFAGAVAANKSYDKKQEKENRKSGYETRLKEEYEYWANLALRLHFKYKVFSVGLINESIFDQNYNFDSIKKSYETYIKTFRINPEEDINRNPTLIERKLQWLEHRRWCAFSRTMGFKHTADYLTYIGKTNSHKNMEMKFHPCLVECEKPVCKGCTKTICNNCTEAPDSMHKFVVEKVNKKNAKGKTTSEVKIKCAIKGDYEYNNSNYDLLDKLSVDLIALKQNKPYKEVEAFSPNDFKQYDYPNNEYLDEILKNIKE